MNIHGYKLKSKNITLAIKLEKSKERNKQSQDKIYRLINAKNRIQKKIKTLKLNKKRKKR